MKYLLLFILLPSLAYALNPVVCTEDKDLLITHCHELDDYTILRYTR